jgi:HEAT repeat protein
MMFNERQLEIARNRELTQLIPQLGDSSATVRKFSAISLSLYGRHAIPALMSAMGDDSSIVREACAKSLSLIGSHAAPALIAAFQDSRGDAQYRGMAMKALALMQLRRSCGSRTTAESSMRSHESPISSPEQREFLTDQG